MRRHHEFVVQVARAGCGHDDGALATGFAPSRGAESDRVTASLAGLSEDSEVSDIVEHREAQDAAGRAERPCRLDAELARRQPRFDALAAGELRPDRIEHDRGAVDDAEHHALRFWPAFRLI